MAFIIELLVSIVAVIQICWVFFSITFGWKVFLLTVLCWWGGSGLRGSLYGDVKQKKIGFISAIVFLSIGLFLAQFIERNIIIDYLNQISIELWQYLVLSFFVGFTLTGKRFATEE